MPHTTVVFVKDTKIRVILVGLGVALVLLAVVTQYQAAHPRPSGPMAPEMVLLCTLSSAYGAAFALTAGLWGGFPKWSHTFIPSQLRTEFVLRHKAYAAARLNPASPYKWGSRLQVRLAQWAIVPLVGWSSTLVNPFVEVFGRHTGIVGACIGGILAIVLAQFLKKSER